MLETCSVPVKFVGKPVTLKALPEIIELWFGGDVITTHQRCYKREQSLYDLAHYLPLLEQFLSFGGIIRNKNRHSFYGIALVSQ
ncbi:hypothetical protein [Ruminococcus sp. FC2018]|uniref:Mu transposase domain-containing protein n=1 Tax=Ruminococcus sp. FC2018 TaxID=1410617 RepID=UPI00048A9D96|nr:hypothetical protein [Ruminococcus sp. FC2018]